LVAVQGDIRKPRMERIGQRHLCHYLPRILLSMANTNQNTVYSAVYDTLGTISRRSNVHNRYTGRMFGTTREPYPSNRDIQRNAIIPANRFEEIGHLTKADILWTAAIVADRQLEHRSCRSNNRRDKFLEDLMEIGLYDRVQGEVRDSAEEVSMRYTSACTSAAMEHVERLETRVSI
jgi:hypothetical protein